MKTTGTPHLSDDQLLTLAQDGDQGAFAELMSRTSSSSFKLALSILKDRQEAEDEVQNSYWNAWRSLGRFQRDSKFSTWISRIVINQCLMRLRKARKASFLHLDEGAGERSAGGMELPDSRPTPEAELGGREMSAMLHREIRRMPPILRSVLVLRDLDELPMDDVAARLGISLVAAKSRLKRARAELKKRLEKQFAAAVRQLVPA